MSVSGVMVFVFLAIKSYLNNRGREIDYRYQHHHYKSSEIPQYEI